MGPGAFVFPSGLCSPGLTLAHRQLEPERCDEKRSGEWQFRHHVVHLGVLRLCLRRDRVPRGSERNAHADFDAECDPDHYRDRPHSALGRDLAEVLLRSTPGATATAQRPVRKRPAGKRRDKAWGRTRYTGSTPTTWRYCALSRSQRRDAGPQFLRPLDNRPVFAIASTILVR